MTPIKKIFPAKVCGIKVCEQERTCVKNVHSSKTFEFQNTPQSLLLQSNNPQYLLSQWPLSKNPHLPALLEDNWSIPIHSRLCSYRAPIHRTYRVNDLYAKNPIHSTCRFNDHYPKIFRSARGVLGEDKRSCPIHSWSCSCRAPMHTTCRVNDH